MPEEERKELEEKKEERIREESEETKESETQEETEEEGLPFPNARVVAIMKKNLAPDKMIRTEVKKAANQFLGQVLADISKRMDQYPYAMVDYWMLEKAIEPYKKIDKMEAEKERLIKHLEALRADIDALIRDIQEM